MYIWGSPPPRGLLFFWFKHVEARAPIRGTEFSPLMAKYKELMGGSEFTCEASCYRERLNIKFSLMKLLELGRNYVRFWKHCQTCPDGIQLDGPRSQIMLFLGARWLQYFCETGEAVILASHLSRSRLGCALFFELWGCDEYYTPLLPWFPTHFIRGIYYIPLLGRGV